MNSNGVEAFTPSRLVLARERRGMTQRELADAIHVSDRMIKSYEAGGYNPTPETLSDLARILSFPVAFFQAPELEPLTLEGASFRAVTKASATLRKRTLAAGSLALDLHTYLSKNFDLPPSDLPDLRTQSPARAADTVRRQWGLGEKPIGNVVHLIEKHGVRVFSLAEDCTEIDAFSFWRDGVPFVFLNTRKTAERSIFDASHELGHLVLHRHGSPQGQDAENEADAFASNFLLPESAIRASAPRLATISTLATMKRTWRASVAALGYRLHELGMMSDWHYRRFNIELSRRGRANEPAPLPRETSAVLRKAIEALEEDSVGLREIAKEVALPVAELRSLTFGLGVLEGGQAGSSTPRRGSLRLVTE
ncbi:MAG TPA: ImmA/IrrE family metallo-endopeptidase [Polyangiaceae bacterium]